MNQLGNLVPKITRNLFLISLHLLPNVLWAMNELDLQQELDKTVTGTRENGFQLQIK
jgi:hypothetical protein